MTNPDITCANSHDELLWVVNGFLEWHEGNPCPDGLIERARAIAPTGSALANPNITAYAQSLAAENERLRAEMRRYLPVLERLEGSPLWHDFTLGLGIATLNGYRAAIAKEIA